MSRETALLRGRAAAERGMSDTCRIERETGETTDPDTGVIMPTYLQIYPDPATGQTAGKCRIQQSQARARGEDAGEAHKLMVDRILQLPIATSLGILAKDLVTVVTCVNDPDVVGKVFKVREEFGKTEATARRLGMEGVTG